MNKWTGAFQIAAVYVGTIVGAGFATGREIVEFFTKYGFYGTVGILFSGYLFIYLGSKIMLIAIEVKAKSFEQLNEHLFGSRFAVIINVILAVMLIGVCAVMFSGAEALFVEQLGFPEYTGLTFTILLTLLVMSIGVKGVFAVNILVVPMMIFFNLLVLGQVIHFGAGFSSLLHFPRWEESGPASLSAISYTSFNLALAQAVLVPVAKEVNDRSAVKWGGVIGGFLLTFILLTSHLSISSLPESMQFEIPMAEIVKRAAGSLYFIYLLIIYGEIFTSIIGNLYGLERQIQRYAPVQSFWIYGGLLAIVIMISQVRYGILLGYLYPLFGYISIGFLILLIFKPIKPIKKTQ